MGVFVDFSNAFDCLNHRKLLFKLEHCGIRGPPLNLLQSYLTDRTQSVVINGEVSASQLLSASVPQGRILGPILFNIYINNIANITDQASCVIYADDTRVFVQSESPDKLCNIVNSTLQKLTIAAPQIH